MIPFGKSMRRRFLLEPGTAFLNHGSFGTTPRVVLAAADRWRRRMEANPDRFLRQVLPGALRGAAARLSRFLNVREKDLVFVENATSGVNAVLRSLEFARGDEILATTHTYNAVRQTIRHVCSQSGANLVEVDIALPVENGFSLLNAFNRKINKRTRLLVLDHISSPTGLIFPVKRPRGRAGDSAQLGIHPPVISHGYGKGFTAEFDWTGTRDFSAWLAVPDAIDFFRNLGPERVRAYCHQLAVQQAKEISAAWQTPCGGPPALHGSLMAIRLPDRLQRRDPRQLMSEWLDRHRIVVPAMPIGGALWARISAQVYNVPGDYRRLRELAARR